MAIDISGLSLLNMRLMLVGRWSDKFITLDLAAKLKRNHVLVDVLLGGYISSNYDSRLTKLNLRTVYHKPQNVFFFFMIRLYGKYKLHY